MKYELVVSFEDHAAAVESAFEEGFYNGHAFARDAMNPQTWMWNNSRAREAIKEQASAAMRKATTIPETQEG